MIFPGIKYKCFYPETHKSHKDVIHQQMVQTVTTATQSLIMVISVRCIRRVTVTKMKMLLSPPGVLRLRPTASFRLVCSPPAAPHCQCG